MTQETKEEAAMTAASETSHTLTPGQFARALAYAKDGSLFPDSEYHGEDHWRAVADQGIWLARLLDLDQRSLTAGLLFGLFHDCRRENDGYDSSHGTRGAAALQECDALAHLEDDLRRTLIEAMIEHDRGSVSDCSMTGLCWDADRSTLDRVGVAPDFRFFSSVMGNDFENFIDRGAAVTAKPPSWEELYRQSLLGD